MRILRGAGVTLEPQVAAHAGELYPLLSEAGLYTYIEDKGPADEAALRERLARLESRTSPDGSQLWLNWVIRTFTGQVAGYVQATVAADGGAEIAYVVGSGHQRHGHGLAAVAVMLEELAASYGVRRATATLDPDNAASLALLRKLGFRFVEVDAAAHEVRYARELGGED